MSQKRYDRAVLLMKGLTEMQRVVAGAQPAFRGCIEQELRKNPSFRGGKVTLTATVGASGTVKGATFDRADVNGSSMGDCLKERAKTFGELLDKAHFVLTLRPIEPDAAVHEV